MTGNRHTHSEGFDGYCDTCGVPTEARPAVSQPRARCRRCGETSPAGCEDWDCHLGWGAR